MLKASEVVARQVAAIRKRRLMSQTDLARRLDDLGYGQLGRTSISKIERGQRIVGVDDWLVLGAALDVSPANLLLSSERQEKMEITPSVVANTAAIRRWLYGWDPLPGGSERLYFSETPPDHSWLQGNPQVREVARLFDRVASAEVTADKQEEADALYDSLFSDVNQLVRDYKTRLAAIEKSEPSEPAANAKRRFRPVF